MFDVISTRPSLEAGALEAIMGVTAATAHEVMGRKGAVDSRIKPISPGMRACGRAFTVWAEPGDNLIVHKALSMAGPGDVLVVCARLAEEGFWGEVMTVAAMARGITALVTDGGVRDTAAIAKRGFPVFAANKCVKGTLKVCPGAINHPIVLGGQLIRPGDIIIADDDGVVVVPYEQAADVASGAIKREAKEAALMERLMAGETTMDALKLWDAWDKLGLTEEAR